MKFWKVVVLAEGFQEDGITVAGRAYIPMLLQADSCDSALIAGKELAECYPDLETDIRWKSFDVVSVATVGMPLFIDQLHDE